MEFVGYTTFRHQVNHFGHLVAASGHHETYAIGLAEHACCGFYKILWTFLHRDAAEEGNQFVFARWFGEFLWMLQWLNSIMHRAYFAWILTVFLDYGLTSQIADTYDVVGLIHTTFLYRINGGVNIATAAVKIGSVYVYYQWFAADVFRKHTCRIGQPVMAVNNVKIQTVCQHTCHSFVVADFFNQVIRIASGEIYATQIICANTTVVVANAIAEMIILLRTHSPFHPLLHIVVIIVFPYHRNTVSTDDAKERLIFVTPWFGNDERDLHVFLLRHATGQTVTGGSQST